MCNIAGYIGKKQAAPILCEMMKKQEGFYGGYYTGIVTHNGEKLCSTKVIGNMENLLNETDAIYFFGTTGFLHSRSKSGGGLEWGHPFLNNAGNLAYIANGSPGCFSDDEITKKRCTVATELEKKGIVFPSRVVGAIGKYPFLSDGTSIHISDLQCQYISTLTDEGMEIDEAMSYANTTLPCEVVSLVMREENPASIFVSRINYPMMIGIATDGDVYLATTALAFPEDVEFRLIELLPPATTCEIFEGGYKTSVHPIAINNVSSITLDICHRAYIRLEELLTGKKDSPLTLQQMCDACADLWPEGTVDQSPPLIYEIIRAMKKENKIKIALVPDEGVLPGYTTNVFKMYI